MKQKRWQGIFSVLVTPFKKNAEINFELFETLIEKNIKNGADGLIVCGSTGEFYTMSLEERISLFNCSVKKTSKRLPVIAGVSDLSMENCFELSKKAEKAGCDGILALPPIYATPDLRETEHFYTTLASQTKLPIMLYNSPKRTGVNLTPEFVHKISEMPQIVAIKDSSGDIRQLNDLCIKVKDKLSVFVGYETMIRPSLSIGCVGVVAMAHQLAGRLIREYFDACKDGNHSLADRLEPAVFAIYACFQSGSFYSGIKAVMSELGQEVGEPRKPLLAFTNTQLNKVRSILMNEDVKETIKELE